MGHITSVGFELEGGWNCTCPTRIASTLGVAFDPVTGVITATGAHGYHCAPEPSMALKVAPEIGKQLAAMDQFKPCTCIPPNVHSDSSVKVRAQVIGEVKPEQGGLTLDEWPAWMEKNYPNAIDMSCGLHVHMRFDSPNTYMALMTPDVETHLINDLCRWGQAYKVPFTHPFWYRILGGNYYARRGQTLQNIDRMVDGGLGNRYFAVNYPYSEHQTMEVRVLPMFKEAKTAIRACNAVIRSITRYLEALPPNIVDEGYKSEELITPDELTVLDVDVEGPHNLGLISRDFSVAESALRDYDVIFGQLTRYGGITRPSTSRYAATQVSQERFDEHNQWRDARRAEHSEVFASCNGA